MLSVTILGRWNATILLLAVSAWANQQLEQTDQQVVDWINTNVIETRRHLGVFTQPKAGGC